MPYPVIDIFAGPGGLSEGFSALGQRNNIQHFRVTLSVEKDHIAHQTLLIRSFLRQFPYDNIPDEYYEFLRKEITLDALQKRYSDEMSCAYEEALHDTLGSGELFNNMLDEKIEKAVAGHNRWVLIGGPPCQAYSIAGRVRYRGVKDYIPEEDGRHYLYKEYLRILAKHRPAVFVMENVKGLLSARLNGKLVFNEVLSDLSNLSVIFPKYNTNVCYKLLSIVKLPKHQDLLDRDLLTYDPHDFVIKSEKYGIPQARHRVFILGVRSDLIVNSPPVLEHENVVAMGKVITGLPRLRSGLSKSQDGKSVWKQTLEGALKSRWLESTRTIAGDDVYNLICSTIGNLTLPMKDRGDEFIKHNKITVADELKDWILDARIGGVSNHSSRSHIVKDLYRYLYASCYAKVYGFSPKLSDFPRDLLPKHNNVHDGHFTDRFRVQLLHMPSTTITCHISKDGHYYIHPDPTQCRSLTVREVARLQTFPDNYYFAGNRTQQYVQVGNAVPPLLAYKIARKVLEILNN